MRSVRRKKEVPAEQAGGEAPARVRSTETTTAGLAKKPATTRSGPRQRLDSEALLSELSDYHAEGLDALEALLVATTSLSARIDAARRFDRDFAKAQDALARAVSTSRSDPGKSVSSPEAAAVFVANVVGLSRSGLIGEAGFVGTPGSSEEEKFAVRFGLSVLAGTSPQVLADAMGAALSTLYSYSDSDRPNRPGQKRLYQAAYLFSRFADEMRSAAEYLTNVARRSPPSRSSETLPRIGGKKVAEDQQSRRSAQ